MPSSFLTHLHWYRAVFYCLVEGQAIVQELVDRVLRIFLNIFFTRIILFDFNLYGVKLTTLIFYSFAVVSRYCDPQRQMGENYSYNSTLTAHI